MNAASRAALLRMLAGTPPRGAGGGAIGGTSQGEGSLCRAHRPHVNANLARRAVKGEAEVKHVLARRAAHGREVPHGLPAGAWCGGGCVAAERGAATEAVLHPHHNTVGLQHQGNDKQHV